MRPIREPGSRPTADPAATGWRTARRWRSETGRRMKSSSGSAACSQTSSAGASASCTDSDASTWTGSSSNGRSDGTGGGGAAKACSRSSTRASRRARRSGRTPPPPDPSKSRRKPGETAGLRSFRPNFRTESHAPAEINILWLRTQSNKPSKENGMHLSPNCLTQFSLATIKLTWPVLCRQTKR